MSDPLIELRSLQQKHGELLTLVRNELLESCNYEPDDDFVQKLVNLGMRPLARKVTIRIPFSGHIFLDVEHVPDDVNDHDLRRMAQQIHLNQDSFQYDIDKFCTAQNSSSNGIFSDSERANVQIVQTAVTVEPWQDDG